MPDFADAPSRAPIILLPPELRNQIAAGEVVDRPAGIIKELLENSLDAGALRIDVSLEQGGLGSLTVRDDGSGISAGELDLAVTSHATSKLRSLAELMAINTLGFRGEALPSIGSVSVLRVTSVAANAAGGEGEAAFIELNFGEVKARGAAALDRGTLVEVRELFANIPARLKFLKTPSTELKRCRVVLERLALNWRGVAFRLYSEGRELCNFPAGRSLAESLAIIWPPELVEAMRPVNFTAEGISVSGLVGIPATAQAKSDRMLFYINGRPVQERTLLAAVRQAYKGRLLGGEYPQAALFVEMPCDMVDVNVHPAKAEVRFRDERGVFSAVLRAVGRALEEPHLDFSTSNFPAAFADKGTGADTEASSRRLGFWGQADSASPLAKKSLSGAESGLFAARQENSFGSPGRELMQRDAGALPPASGGWPNPRAGLAESPAGYGREAFGEALPFPEPSVDRDESVYAPPAAPSVEGGSRAPELNYLGQVAATYLVAECGRDSLLLLDQHAVHEAVLYARLRERGLSGESRPLALPLRLNLHPAEAESLDERWGDLTALGFKLSRVGALSLSLEAAPPDLSAGEAREFLQELLSDRVEGGLEELWAMMACKAAVKARDALTGDEARELLRQWAENPAARYCPHGRPTAVVLSRADLEKLFKRRV